MWRQLERGAAAPMTAIASWIVLSCAVPALAQTPDRSLPKLFPAPSATIQPTAKPGPVPPAKPAPVSGDRIDTAPRLPADPTLVPSPEKLGEQATRLLRDVLPREFENSKKWGLTKRIVSGVDVDRDGLKFTTHRRWKEVNDGLWKRYRATLVDPEQRLQLKVVRIEETDAGRVQMDMVLDTALDLEARVVKYKRNLRLFSLTAHADAEVRLELDVELGASLDPTKLPPDIVFDVVVKDAKLELVKFRLRRLSDIKGVAARQLGKLVEELAEDELKDQRRKLVEKLNKKIDKKRDRLRFSFHDLLPESLQPNRDDGDDQGNDEGDRERVAKQPVDKQSVDKAAATRSKR